MTRDNIKRILGVISNLKKRNGIEIVDTHVHPYDVMGAVHYEDVKKSYKEIDYFKSGILEKLKYGRIEKIGSRAFFKLFPREVNGIIKSTYTEVNQESLLNEMDCSLVDKSVLLPVEPWLPTKVVGENYNNNERFLILGSIDIHSIQISEIESTVDGFIEKYKIIGLKFHPNLQNFKPQPSQNSSDIAEKLRKIYSVAEKRKLYLLFHGGISNFTDSIDPKYGNFQRSRTNAVLENFCDSDGNSELFEYNIPIVIAHLGHYGIAWPNYRLIKMIADRYKNVFFDTSGVSLQFIKNVIELISSKRIIFGSDALYNRVAYNLIFLFLAAKRVNNGESFENILANTLSLNFYKDILGR